MNHEFQMWTRDKSHSAYIAATISLVEVGERKFTFRRSGYYKRGNLETNKKKLQQFPNHLSLFFWLFVMQ